MNIPSPRRLWIVIGAFSLLGMSYLLNAAPPVKLTDDIAAPADLTAEIDALYSEISSGVANADEFREKHNHLKRQAVQLAIFSQAIADHSSDSPLKKSAPALRNAALAMSRANGHEEAMTILPRLSDAMAGKLSGTPAAEIEWGKLARASSLMSMMKERSEAVRRGLRRPKNADVESRQALAIALMAMSVHGDLQSVKNPADRPAWQEASLELQGHMSKAAAAIKAADGTAADHFRMGMEACDKCHLKFKP